MCPTCAAIIGETSDVRIVNLLSIEEPDLKPALRHMANDHDSIIARIGQMLLDLLNHLEADGNAPLVFAQIYCHEMWLSPANQYNRAMVKIGVDWPDYGPLRDGLPAMHYRLQISRRVGGPSRDGRSRDIAEVKRLICEAFGWR